MAVRSAVPDYDLPDSLTLEGVEQHRALFDRTRVQIVEMLSERAATASQLAQALGRPKGTVGHHVGVLESAGLIHVVRTEKVRAVEAKYFGRTARTFLFSAMPDLGIEASTLLAAAAEEMAEWRRARPDADLPDFSSVRHARIPAERAQEWADRLGDLLSEFADSPRGGDVVYGMAVALYPTDRPHLDGKGRGGPAGRKRG